MTPEELLRLLPHRYPFLMLDRILEVVPGQSLVALKNVSANEPWVPGHFPARAIMPGVLLLEAMAQACGAVALSAHPDALSVGQRIVLLAGVDAVRFRRPVVPGDQVRIHAAKVAEKRGLWKFSVRCEVDGRVAAEAEVMATMAEG
jgi:3-hydroxyacyl-[acyl-carrier-protein] dehydratase